MAASTATVPATRTRPPRRRFGERAAKASGQRLVQAFSDIARLPALEHSRHRLQAALDGGRRDRREIISAIESDPALTLAVLRSLAASPGPKPRKIGVPQAVDSLSPADLYRIAADIPAVDFLDRSSALAGDAESFRLHGLAAQRAAETIRAHTNFGNRDEIAAVALLHDIGKVVLLSAYDAYREIAFMRGSPEERLAAERSELGIDHVTAGSVLARRLGLPKRFVDLLAAHHADGAGRDVALIRLADMLAHYEAGHPVEPDALRRTAGELGLTDGGLRTLLYALPKPSDEGERSFDPSPLSDRQHDILRRLADGESYKEIAEGLGLSASTVRSHLQAIYMKLDVSDRARAVLEANRRGWI